MHLLDRLKVYLFHRQRIKNSGYSPSKKQGWSSEQAQQKRFEAVLKSGAFSGKHIVDLGCGYGELASYLSKTEAFAKYTGVDQQPHFLSQAKQRTAQPNCVFKRGDLSTTSVSGADIVIASGSLNYKSRDPEYVTKVIRHMYQMANERVVFNLLDSNVFPEQALLIGYNKQGIYRYCKSMCDDVELIDDYTDEDFTIVMRKS